jgi:cysteine/O-acetylserine efflux protein
MFFMCWTPGPNTMLCAAHGNRHGWYGTMPLEAGMAVGFFSIAILVGGGVEFVRDNDVLLDAVKYIGAAYMLYLAVHIARAPPIGQSGDHEAVAEKPLGPLAGFLLQFVNPKSWVYFLLLMTEYASRLGEGFPIVVILAATTTVIGVGSVLFWSGAGAVLRRVFADPKSSARVNLGLGLILAFVAIDIAFHEQLYSLF